MDNDLTYYIEGDDAESLYIRLNKFLCNHPVPWSADNDGRVKKDIEVGGVNYNFMKGMSHHISSKGDCIINSISVGYIEGSMDSLIAAVSRYYSDDTKKDEWSGLFVKGEEDMLMPLKMVI